MTIVSSWGARFNGDLGPEAKSELATQKAARISGSGAILAVWAQVSCRLLARRLAVASPRRAFSHFERSMLRR